MLEASLPNDWNTMIVEAPLPIPHPAYSTQLLKVSRLFTCEELCVPMSSPSPPPHPSPSFCLPFPQFRNLYLPELQSLFQQCNWLQTTLGLHAKVKAQGVSAEISYASPALNISITQSTYVLFSNNTQTCCPTRCTSCSLPGSWLPLCVIPASPISTPPFPSSLFHAHFAAFPFPLLFPHLLYFLQMRQVESLLEHPAGASDEMGLNLSEMEQTILRSILPVKAKLTSRINEGPKRTAADLGPGSDGSGQRRVKSSSDPEAASGRGGLSLFGDSLTAAPPGGSLPSPVCAPHPQEAHISSGTAGVRTVAMVAELPGTTTRGTSRRRANAASCGQGGSNVRNESKALSEQYSSSRGTYEDSLTDHSLFAAVDPPSLTRPNSCDWGYAPTSATARKGARMWKSTEHDQSLLGFENFELSDTSMKGGAAAAVAKSGSMLGMAPFVGSGARGRTSSSSQSSILKRRSGAASASAYGPDATSGEAPREEYMSQRRRRRLNNIVPNPRKPRPADYTCAACCEPYHVTAVLNPWWATVPQQCPKCSAIQVPRFDITAPINSIGNDPNALALFGEGVEDSGEEDSEESDDDGFGGPGGSETDELDECAEAAKAPEAFNQEGLLRHTEAAQLLLLMCHARTCAGLHSSEPQAGVCRSIKYLLLHLRDCEGADVLGAACKYPWCMPAKCLLDHVTHCYEAAACSMCNPVDATLPKSFQQLRAINRSRRIVCYCEPCGSSDNIEETRNKNQ